MDTRLCSPLILPDSASGAWVDEYFSPSNTGSGDLPYTVMYALTMLHFAESIPHHYQPPEFRASQFACRSQWRHQIPLHWRLKESLKGVLVFCCIKWCLCTAIITVSTAQHIARAALDAFQLTNRDNVFVVQEIDPEMQESIYYLRSVDGIYDTQMFRFVLQDLWITMQHGGGGAAPEYSWYYITEQFEWSVELLLLLYVITWMMWL